MSIKKTHIDGTNNRTFCGIKKNDKTSVLAECSEYYLSDCVNCLFRLADDKTYVMKCFHDLKKWNSLKRCLDVTTVSPAIRRQATLKDTEEFLEFIKS